MMLILFAESADELEREADEEIMEERPRLMLDCYPEEVLESEAA